MTRLSRNTAQWATCGKEGCKLVYPYTSIFPDGIDKRTFFCDVDLNTKSYQDKYNELLKQGKYSDAATLLAHSPIHSYTAEILNYIEVKTKHLQDYVLAKEKYNPYHVSDTEPDIDIGEIWF